jgi:ABC-type multidrug transport system permease subunit
MSRFQAWARRFWAVLDTRNKEFLRDRSALAWNIMFPVLVVFGFAFAFSGNNQEVFKAGVHGIDPLPAAGFFATRHVTFVPEADLGDALAKLRRHQLDLVIAPGKYWLNSSSPKGYLLEKILAGSDDGRAYARQAVEGREIRYVDWLISGLLGMNMMFSALFGVGYTIVRYRKNGVLKRLKATPLHAIEFLSAQVLSRLLLLVAVSVAVYVGCNFFIHFQMLGSYANLFLVLVLGAMCLISLGLLMAARSSSEEFAGGILNLISWPMMFLSGVWFSLEGADPWVKRVAQVFPLTHVIDAARAIMTEGAGLDRVGGHLVVLAAMTALFLVAGSLAFKWE